MYYDALRRRVHAAMAQREAVKAAHVPIENLLAPCYLPLHADIQAGRHTFYNLPGGRGSCKLSTASLEIVDGLTKDPTANAIVFRRTGATLRESVYTQIQWALDELGVASVWRGSISPLRFTNTLTGQQILFRGLDDAQKLKSIKPRHGVFKYVWLEEFSELNGENQVRSVLQSVVRGKGSFVVFNSFNPPLSRSHWANLYVEQPNERALTFRTTYLDIPPAWLGEEFLLEAARLKEINPTAYANEYLGEACGDGGEVFQNLEIREITDDEISEMQYFYCGCDFGFSVDPAAVLYLSYDKKYETLYFIDEIYQRGLSNAELADLIKQKGFDKDPAGYEQTIFCDSAEPKSCRDLKELGLRALPTPKWGGSVRYGVAWLQHRRIVIDPRRTPNAHREFTQYEYCRTRDGELTSDLPDKANHLIDSLRYSLSLVIGSPRNPA